VGEADADTVDAAVGAGEDFEAETVFFDDFAGEGDVAGDLGDEAAQGGGFVVLGKAEGSGVVSCVARYAVAAQIVRAALVWIMVVEDMIAKSVVAKVVGTDVAEVVLFGGVGEV